MIRRFGTTTTGVDVEAITLRAGDLTVVVLTRGAAGQSVRLAGVAHDLTLGSEDLADYEGPLRYHGALIGPVANRISGAKIAVGGASHHLDANGAGGHCLHSGPEGTHTRLWDIVDSSEAAVALRVALPDGACGLPGNRTISAAYTIIAPATLHLVVRMETDAPTPANFANHSYWNLDGTETWQGHSLRLGAEAFLPTTPDLIPTGTVQPVEGTPYDFRTLRTPVPGEPHLDTNFCLSSQRKALRDVLWLTGQSGVTLTLATTEPGLQIYDDRPTYRGLAIEAQFWPDAPHHPGFPGILLAPDMPWEQITQWRFTKA